MEDQLRYVPMRHREFVLDAIATVRSAFGECPDGRVESSLTVAGGIERAADPATVAADLDESRWFDLLEQRRAEYMTCEPWGNDSALRFEADREVLSLSAEAEIELRDELMGQGISEDHINRVCGLLTDVALARAALGRQSRFWEQMLDCLRAKLVPVGYVGKWPRGTVRVVALG